MGVVYRGDGINSTVRDKEVYAEVVSLDKSLEQLFHNKEIFELIRNNDYHENEFYRSIRDGFQYKNNAVCQKYPDALLLQLYEDNVEVVNQ